MIPDPKNLNLVIQWNQVDLWIRNVSFVDTNTILSLSHSALFETFWLFPLIVLLL